MKFVRRREPKPWSNSTKKHRWQHAACACTSVHARRWDDWLQQVSSRLWGVPGIFWGRRCPQDSKREMHPAALRLLYWSAGADVHGTSSRADLQIALDLRGWRQTVDVPDETKEGVFLKALLAGVCVFSSFWSSRRRCQCPGLLLLLLSSCSNNLSRIDVRVTSWMALCPAERRETNRTRKGRTRAPGQRIISSLATTVILQVFNTCCNGWLTCGSMTPSTVEAHPTELSGLWALDEFGSLKILGFGTPPLCNQEKWPPPLQGKKVKVGIIVGDKSRDIL